MKKGINFSCIKLLQSYVCMVTISCSLRHQWVGHHLNLQSITNKPTHSTQTGWVEHGVQANGHLAAPPPSRATAKNFVDAFEDASLGRCHDEMKVKL